MGFQYSGMFCASALGLWYLHLWYMGYCWGSGTHMFRIRASAGFMVLRCMAFGSAGFPVLIGLVYLGVCDGFPELIGLEYLWVCDGFPVLKYVLRVIAGFPVLTYMIWVCAGFPVLTGRGSGRDPLRGRFSWAPSLLLRCPVWGWKLEAGGSSQVRLRRQWPPWTNEKRRSIRFSDLHGSGMVGHFRQTASLETGTASFNSVEKVFLETHDTAEGDEN